MFEMLNSNNNDMKEHVTDISRFCQKATVHDSLLIELKADLTVSQTGLGLVFQFSPPFFDNKNLEVFVYISQSKMIILSVAKDLPAGMTSLDLSIENLIKQELKKAKINLGADFHVKTFHIMTGHIHRNQLKIAKEGLAFDQFKMKKSASGTGLEFQGIVFATHHEILQSVENQWSGFECNRYILDKTMYLSPIILTYKYMHYNKLLSEQLFKGGFSYMHASEIITSTVDAKIFFKATMSRFTFKLFVWFLTNLILF